MKTLVKETVISHNNVDPKELKWLVGAIRDFQNFGGMLQTSLDKHVFGQGEMVTAIVAAVLSDIKLCLVGKSGVGKTHAAEKIKEILGLKGQILPLNPDVTCADITGNMVLDLETRRKVYWPSPFLNGNQMIILDELNRSSDKAQTALLDIINGNRVMVDGVEHKLSEVFTTIMTMNPPEDPGTRPIINALADRIDYTLHVRAPGQETVNAILAYHFSPNSNSFETQHPSDYRFEDMLAMKSRENEIREARQIVERILNSHIDNEVLQTASFIQQGFQEAWNPATSADWIPETVEWDIPATARTAISMVQMATIVALLKEGKLPAKRHIWNVAAGCLGMIKPVDWMTTEQRLKLIKMRIEELRFPSKSRPHTRTAPSKQSSNGQSSNGRSPDQHSRRKLKKELQSSNGRG